MADDKKTENKSIFSKIASSVSDTILNYEIKKAQAFQELEKAKGSSDDESSFYFKSVTEDPTYSINSQGFKEKPNRILNSHLKQMAYKDSVICAIIQTRQNQVSNFSRLVKSEQEKGFIIKLKDEETMLKKIKEELMAEQGSKIESDLEQDQTAPIEDPMQLGKAREIYSDQESEFNTNRVSEVDGESSISDAQNHKDDDDTEAFNWELDRRAKEKLEEKISNRRKKLEEYIVNCGELDGRPFETKKWNFDSSLRAWVRDSLTYDLLATEVVPNKVGKPHHFFPVDGSTIKFASTALKRYKSFPGSTTNVDFLYPEKHLQALEKKDALELDESLLEAEKYKYVQVVKGKIERAYTEDEMKIGIRNLSTDIYNNGYGISELELLVSLVSSHLNTEYYNKAYFTQGFSAKGILHLKAAIPRRKLETIRQQWHHMIKGNRNSFQTPIFAGMDEVKWIPLTQNHSDIEFQGWMNYLIKMMCAIYQIDPKEIGLGFKDEGGSKGGMSGDDTREKLAQSKDKGLYPLLRFLENYINTNIISVIDSDFEIRFTGVEAESQKFALERQEKEVKFKKTVNEVRAEDGLPPLPGMDDIILDPTYMQWYTAFSQKGMQKQKENQMQMNQQSAPQTTDKEDTSSFQDGTQIPDDIAIDKLLAQDFNAGSMPQPPIEKSLKIEYYKIGK